MAGDWAGVFRQLAKSLDVITRFAKAIPKTYDASRYVIDDISIRNLRDRLTKLIAEMSGLNADKVVVGKDLKHYLDDDPYRKDWSKLQEHLAASAIRVGAICEAAKRASVDIVTVCGPDLFTELQAALRMQQENYEWLAGMPEPRSAKDKAAARRIAKTLQALLVQVKSIERNLHQLVKAKPKSSRKLSKRRVS